MRALIKKGEVKRALQSVNKHIILISNDKSVGDDSKAIKIRANSMKKLSNGVDKIYRWMFGDIDDNKRINDANREKSIKGILNSETNLFLTLTQNIQYLEFNVAKKMSHILVDIIEKSKINHCHEYIESLTDINNHNPMIQSLIDQYNQPNCSDILYEMVKCPELSSMFLSIEVTYGKSKGISNEDEKEREQAMNFIDMMTTFVQSPDLVICTSACKTLRCLLSRSDENISEYLDKHFDGLFDKINQIITYDDSMMQKQLLILLHDTLTNANNYEIMMRYLKNTKYLLLAMDLMRKYQQNSISFEAWHIFKLFVANKKKEKDITQILKEHKDDLIFFLQSFHPKNYNDSDFQTEKDEIIQTLRGYFDVINA